MTHEQFPLLRLPPSAVSYVLGRITDGVDIITLSTISNRTKAAVMAINFTIPHMQLTLGKQSWITFRLSCDSHWALRKGYSAEWTGDDINEPLFLCRDHLDYRKKGYTLKHWLDHFMEISKKTEFDVLCLNKPKGEINLDGIRQHIGSVRGILFHISYDLAFHENLMANFPSTKIIYVHLANADVLRSKVLVSNFDQIGVHQSNVVKLDDLLTMNAKTIQLNYFKFTDSELNKFLKAWKRGACPRLKIFRTSFISGQPNLERILRGTEYQNGPAEREKTIEIYNMALRAASEVTIVGGQDIRGKNGKIGTVSIVQNRFNWMEFRFYVWE